MKILSLISTLVLTLFATDTKLCKTCHPTIYSEFQQSLHKKSSKELDKVHNAVWNLHPLKKKGDYKCAKCHAPQNEKSINCLSCHTIKSIEKHKKTNTNIYEQKPKLFYSAQKESKDKKLKYTNVSKFFGLFGVSKGSPYHEIDYSNEIFYDGSLCMGCHSHKQNSHNFTVCKTTASKDKKQNCISCHMPKVVGSATTIRQSKTHAFHGFSGVRNYHEMLKKYIELSYKKDGNGFSITIKNRAPHDLLTHPLRVLKLVTKLKRDGETRELKSHTFVKVLGKDGKPAMPWVADMILKNSMIKADETRVIKFQEKLQKGDEIEATLGFFIVNPKAAKKLKLEDEKSLTSFIIFKKLYVNVNN